MGMTFWPLERRLDTAIFRAMFASSVRTARQFVVHGHVKVNGKKIKYPGYLLNPGDMFSVDPELVMLSTGMPNSASKQKYVYNNPPLDAPENFPSIKNKDKRAEARRQKQDQQEANALKASSEAAQSQTVVAEGESAAATAAEAPSEPVSTSTATTAAVEGEETEAMSANKLKSRLKDIESRITTYLRSPLGKGYVFRTRRSKRIHALRELRRQVREAIKNAAESTDPAAAADATTLKPLSNKLERASTQQNAILSHLETHNSLSSPKSKSTTPPQDHLTLLKSWPNARQQDKPYLTPWLPRNWMSAFAFIPRYLEVNQNVCSAVYLRHPVARPGVAEVPGPYGAEMGLLAYQWYLRRR